MPIVWPYAWLKESLWSAEQSKVPSFRLDKQALEATTTRQLQVKPGHVLGVQGIGLGFEPSR